MLGFEIFQMCVEHPEEKIDIVSRLRNFENALVSLLARKSDPQGQFPSDEINAAQAQRELLQKAAEHEKERLSRFDFVFELESFHKRLRELDQLEQSRRFSIGLVPKANCFRPEPSAEIFSIKRS